MDKAVAVVRFFEVCRNNNKIYLRYFFYKNLPKICHDFKKHYPAISPSTKDSPEFSLVLDMVGNVPHSNTAWKGDRDECALF